MHVRDDFISVRKVMNYRYRAQTVRIGIGPKADSIAAVIFGAVDGISARFPICSTNKSQFAERLEYISNDMMLHDVMMHTL